MIQYSLPPLWNSAHRPIRFIFKFDEKAVGIVDNGGFAQFNFGGIFFKNPAVGEKFYVLAGAYQGEHTITEIVAAGTQFKTGTIFTAQALSSAYHLYVPTFKLYSGYRPGEEYPTQLPYTLVASWTPEYNTDYQVITDISEYVQSAFRIVPPTEGIDFNMFNRFRMEFDYSPNIVYSDFRMVVNASIKTEDLMSDYVNNSSYLNTRAVPIVFTCGRTILSTLEGNVVINKFIDHAVMGSEGDYSADDYSNDFNIE